MPEMSVVVRWPDGREQDCYSPSLVMHDHLAEGGSYAVADFVTRATTALGIASDRVRAKYGFACTSAMAQKERLALSSARFDTASGVRVLTMHPPLPPVG